MFEQELPRFRRQLRLRLYLQGLLLGLQIGGPIVVALTVIRWLGFGEASLGFNSLQEMGFKSDSDPFVLIVGLICIVCVALRAGRSLPEPLVLSAIETRANLGAALSSAWEFNQRQHPMAGLLARRASAALQTLDPKVVFPHPGFKGIPLFLACTVLSILIFRAQPLGLEATQALLQRPVALSQASTQAALDAANQLRELAGDARSVEELARQASRSVQDLAQGKKSLGEALDSLGQLEDSARAQAELEASREALIQALEDESSPARKALEEVARQGPRALNNPGNREAINELAEATSGDETLRRNLQSIAQGLDPAQNRHAAAELLRRASELQAESSAEREARRQAISQLEQKIEALRQEATNNGVSSSSNEAPSPSGEPTKIDPGDPSSDPRPSNQAPENKPESQPKAGASPNETSPEPSKPGATQPEQRPGSSTESASADPMTSPEASSPNSTPPEGSDRPSSRPEGQPKTDPAESTPKAAEPERNSTSPDSQPSAKNPDEPGSESPAPEESNSGGFTDLAAELAKSLLESGMTPPKELMESLSGMAPEGGEPPQWARDLAEKLVEKGFKLPDDFEMPDLPPPSATNEPSPEMKAWQDRLARKLMEKGFEIPKGLEDAARKAAEKAGASAPDASAANSNPTSNPNSKLDPAWQKDLAERLQGLGLQAPEQKGGKPAAESKPSSESGSGSGSGKAPGRGEAGPSGGPPSTAEKSGAQGGSGAGPAGEPATGSVKGPGAGATLGGAAETGNGAAALPGGELSGGAASTSRGGSTIKLAPSGRNSSSSSPGRTRLDPLDEAERRGVELPPRYRDYVKRYFEKRASKEPSPEAPASSGE